MSHSRIEDLLADFVARRESGEPLSIEAFVNEHPEREQELQRVLSALADVEAIFPGPESGLPVQDDTPRNIGPWRVLGTLGRGGMGHVWRVELGGEPGVERALKQLHPLAAANPRTMERFRREGAVLRELDHEGIVRIVAIEADAEPPYLVMELIEGTSLARLLERARSSPDGLELPGDGPVHRRAALIIAVLADAVHAAHLRGLLHRDLKPSNVVLREDGRPVLIDFGLAVHEESATLTESGDLLGTPYYMASEQALGRRADARTDVYGLGAVLYELLTLHPPHEGRDPLEVLEKIRRQPVRSLRRLAPATPKALARVVERAMEWRPNRRYPSALDLAKDLEACARGGSPSAGTRPIAARVEDLVRFHSRALTIAAVGSLLAVTLALASRGETSRERAVRLHETQRAATLAYLKVDEAELRVSADALAAFEEGAMRAAFLMDQPERIQAGLDPAVDALLAGREFDRAGEPVAAAAAYARAAEHAPEWGLPLVFQARAALAAGETERAERELTAAVRRLPKSVSLAVELAELFRKQERPGAARAELERVIDLAPNDLELWIDLIGARMRTEDTEAAFAAAERALELEAEPSQRVLNRYAAILDRMGDHDAALEIFSRLLEKNPNSALIRFNLGYSLDSQCLLAQAREQYLQVVEQIPDAFKPTLSLAHLASGSMRNTCERCERAFEEDPDLFDPDEAEHFMVRAIEIDRCETEWLPGFAVSVANKVSRFGRIESALRASIEGAEVDERVVRVERALRKMAAR